MPTIKTFFAIAFACAVTAGCTTTGPVVYDGLASASVLKPNPNDQNGREPFVFRGDISFRQYTRMIVDPVTVYAGADAQFGKVSAEDKQALARYMQSEFTDKLKTRFSIVTAPQPNTLRLHLTLTGAKANTPVLGTLSHFDVAGGVYNGVQAVRGGEGSMTGSVNYAVEVYDATTSRLLLAYVSKQFPGAMNIGASMGSMQASMVGVEKGADALLAKLR
ncbi:MULTISPECIES: DUF3313 domain-containing protein [Rhizobium]|uniref:DUF3313 domain-containing protein n=1 Tax=Rhizobium rhododendri TaxID=2506430 RepID=A0ABY8IQT0_9HYPH|nr:MULTISPECIES: DUF3313 domain-containing protein [Rhizobium]QXZ81373.1 DUF3313 domain-containing protein [Rhizobium sp. L51/94]TQX85730.1 DUF3313 domain-containing protein [Rhizobium sp. rho-13.1]TQY10483.1 DUF3313 domain-containing protein [Rhizobium sp. rho-1.1]WFS25676.1 DUF3313 domain-containing protein [Rhizobium rhododendri]